MENKNKKVIKEMLKSFTYLIENAIKRTTKIYDGVVISSASNNKWNVKYNGEVHTIRIYGKTIPEANQMVKVFVPQGNNSLTWFMLPNEKSGGGSGGSGENGATFTPSVSEDGIISWTNDKNLPNPSSVNIKGKDGKQGEQGPQGLQGVPGKDGTDGKTGPQGPQGIQGNPGKDGKDGEMGQKGDQGLPGKSATISIGKVESVENSAPASITNTGTENDAIFNFKIPKGKNGINGNKVAVSDTSVEVMTKTESEFNRMVDNNEVILIDSNNADLFEENDIAVVKGYVSDLKVNCLVFGIVTGGARTELQLQIFSFIKDGVDGSSGSVVADHNKLINRDRENQHPISAISKLTEVLSNKVDRDLVQYSRVVDGNSVLEMVEKSTDLGDSKVLQSYRFAARDCDLLKRFDYSQIDHALFDNIRLKGDGQFYGKDVAPYWIGAIKFQNIFAYSNQPFYLDCEDVTDTYINNSTFENFTEALIVNSPFLKISTSYFGDNKGYDNLEKQSVLSVNGNTKVDFDKCTVGIGVASKPTYCIDFSNSTGSTVRLKDCQLTISNQNVEEGRYGAIGNPKQNDRLIIDNCLFGVFPKRVNDHHSVAPYELKNYKTVYSETPFYSYIINGKLTDVNRFSPDYASKVITIDDVSVGQEAVNPFGGHIIKFKQYGFYAYYSIPEDMVGRTMYIHVYLCGYKNTRNGTPPTINYDDSDCVENGTGKTELEEGFNMERTPLLNIIPFTPNKQEGKISVFTNNPSGETAPDAEVRIAGMFLVDEMHKDMICDYAEFSNQILCSQIPRYTAEKFTFVKSTSPVETDCYGWVYDGAIWKPVSFPVV